MPNNGFWLLQVRRVRIMLAAVLLRSVHRLLQGMYPLEVALPSQTSAPKYEQLELFSHDAL